MVIPVERTEPTTAERVGADKEVIKEGARIVVDLLWDDESVGLEQVQAVMQARRISDEAWTPPAITRSLEVARACRQISLEGVAPSIRGVEARLKNAGSGTGDYQKFAAVVAVAKNLHLRSNRVHEPEVVDETPSRSHGSPSGSSESPQAAHSSPGGGEVISIKQHDLELRSLQSLFSNEMVAIRERAKEDQSLLINKLEEMQAARQSDYNEVLKAKDQTIQAKEDSLRVLVDQARQRERMTFRLGFAALVCVTLCAVGGALVVVVLRGPSPATPERGVVSVAGPAVSVPLAPPTPVTTPVAVPITPASSDLVVPAAAGQHHPDATLPVTAPSTTTP